MSIKAENSSEIFVTTRETDCTEHRSLKWTLPIWFNPQFLYLWFFCFSIV